MHPKPVSLQCLEQLAPNVLKYNYLMAGLNVDNVLSNQYW